MAALNGCPSRARSPLPLGEGGGGEWGQLPLPLGEGGWGDGGGSHKGRPLPKRKSMADPLCNELHRARIIQKPQYFVPPCGACNWPGGQLYKMLVFVSGGVSPRRANSPGLLFLVAMLSPGQSRHGFRARRVARRNKGHPEARRRPRGRMASAAGAG